MVTKKVSRTRLLRTATGALKPPGAGAQYNAPESYLGTGVQSLMSTGHPVSRLGKGQDIGGPFVTQRQDYGGGDQNFHLYRPLAPTGYHYKGVQTIKASFNSAHFPDALASSDSDLNQKGATAIARCEPTNPAFSTSTFLGEVLREGVPKMIGQGTFESKGRYFHSLGDEYLNVQFGWAPFKRDVEKFLHAVTHSTEVLRQYRRDSGKNIRRRYVFPSDTPESKTVELSDSYPAPLLPTSLYLTGHGPGKLRYTDSSSTRTWFSGCFTYYSNFGDSQFDKMMQYYEKAQRLLGIEITPEVLWNLTPWSWAADWFTNAGDVLHNISALAFHGLVIRYGYIMETTTVTRVYNLDDIWYTSEPWSHGFSQTFSTTRKVRGVANPFGFGVKMEDLSPYQISILAALGISRSG